VFKFLLAYAAVFVPLFAWGVFGERDPFIYTDMGTGQLAALLVGVPCLGAWIAAEALERIRPRRVFDPRVHRAWTLLFAGVGAGILSVLFATPMIVWLDEKAPDGVLLAGASVAATACVLLMLGRKRRGECVQCGYDLTATIEPRCPECGAMYSVVK
jgi:hypothetical protein